MKVLITGANGQLGSEMQIALRTQPYIETLFTDVAELDICNAEAVEKLISDFRPNFIVNCAAYTAVDNAEDNESLAINLNQKAIENIGISATQNHAKVIHISTDYVFDGMTHQPYIETDNTNPQSIYGKTKLAGENALRSVCAEHIIIRTAWLYSKFGNNFVKTMLRLGNERNTLNVVFDQIGTPTYAKDLANTIISIINNERTTYGTFHFSNEGVCSWYDFTKTIFDIKGINCHVNPIESNSYPTKAKRPFYSVLNKKKIKTTYNISIPHWTESLKKCLEEIE